MTDERRHAMGFGFGFSAFDVMFVLMFGVILVLFIVTAVRGISTWSKNLSLIHI